MSGRGLLSEKSAQELLDGMVEDSVNQCGACPCDPEHMVEETRAAGAVLSAILSDWYKRTTPEERREVFKKDDLLLKYRRASKVDEEVEWW